MSHLILVPLKILPQIGNTLNDNYDGFGPGVALFTPHLYHYPLGLVDLTCKGPGPVPSVIPLPLRRPQPLTKMLP